MSEIIIKPTNQDFIAAIDFMQQALDAFKRGLAANGEPMQEAPAAVVEETREAETAKEVKTEAPAKAEVKAEPGLDADVKLPTIDEIRKVFAKIMLDDKVGGKALLQKQLQAHGAKKLSELNPDHYLGILTDAVGDYKSALNKKDPENAAEKLKEMSEWDLPF